MYLSWGYSLDSLRVLQHSSWYGRRRIVDFFCTSIAILKRDNHQSISNKLRWYINKLTMTTNSNNPRQPSAHCFPKKAD